MNEAKNESENRAKSPDLRLRFPPEDHNGCRALTEFTSSRLPAEPGLGKTLKLQQNQEIWRPDDRADKVYFLESGAVEIVCCDGDGREVILEIVETGKAFGEMCFCSGETMRRRTTARATADSRIVAVTITDFIVYFQRDAQALGDMLFTLCLKLGHKQRHIEILARRTVEERVGSALLYLAEFRGSKIEQPLPGGNRTTNFFRLEATHDELAGLTATSRQRVTAAMIRFRELELIAYERSQPITINEAALSKHLQIAAAF